MCDEKEEWGQSTQFTVERERERLAHKQAFHLGDGIESLRVVDHANGERKGEGRIKERLSS